MKETVLKIISIICITLFSCFLLYFGHPYLACFAEIIGLAIVFNSLDAISRFLF